MVRAATQQNISRHHFTLNTDGRTHPLQNAGSTLTAVFAVIAATCAFIPSAHLLGSWTGLGGLVSGLWAQMISATTAERFVDIIAVVLSGVGLLFGLAHGGLY